MELKPCPFCGGEAHAYCNNLWHVGCEHAHNGCVTMSAFVTKAEAIEAWNTRTVLTCTKETAGEGETHWYRCSNCKHAIDPGAYFCSLCGAKVVS